jgi:hypothetical protein
MEYSKGTVEYVILSCASVIVLVIVFKVLGYKLSK